MTNELTWTTNEYGTRTVHRTELVDFGVADDKGRAVGTVAYIVVENGRIELSTEAQRGGRKFGAISSGTTVASVDEAKALAVKKVAAARQRAVKAWAKS